MQMLAEHRMFVQFNFLLKTKQFKLYCNFYNKNVTVKIIMYFSIKK